MTERHDQHDEHEQPEEGRLKRGLRFAGKAAVVGGFAALAYSRGSASGYQKGLAVVAGLMVEVHPAVHVREHPRSCPNGGRTHVNSHARRYRRYQPVSHG